MWNVSSVKNKWKDYSFNLLAKAFKIPACILPMALLKILVKWEFCGKIIPEYPVIKLSFKGLELKENEKLQIVFTELKLVLVLNYWFISK